jgi:transposase
MAKLEKKVGIGISKENFDVACIEAGKMKTRKYSCTASDIKKFISTQDSATHCVMESTGVYHCRLSHALYEAGIAVSVVNSLSVKRFFIQSKMQRTKTEKSDAVMLIEYGSIMEPELWQPDEAHYTQAQQLLNIQSQLIKSRTSITNQMEAIHLSVNQSKTAIALLKKQLKFVEKQLEQIDRELEELVDKYADEDVDSLQSIPGIGRKTTIALMVYTKGLINFDNCRKVASYFVISPCVVQLGSRVKGRGKICKMGMGHIRMLLYMCVRSAKKYNRACRELYERLLAKGKAKKLALIAVANKLLKQAFAVVKNKSVYLENYA